MFRATHPRTNIAVATSEYIITLIRHTGRRGAVRGLAVAAYEYSSIRVFEYPRIRVSVCVHRVAAAPKGSTAAGASRRVASPRLASPRVASSDSATNASRVRTIVTMPTRVYTPLSRFSREMRKSRGYKSRMKSRSLAFHRDSLPLSW